MTCDAFPLNWSIRFLNLCAVGKGDDDADDGCGLLGVIDGVAQIVTLLGNDSGVDGVCCCC